MRVQRGFQHEQLGNLRISRPCTSALLADVISHAAVLCSPATYMQTIAREVGRPFPAYYLAAATQEVLRAAATLCVHSISRAGAAHRASSLSTPVSSSSTPATLAGAPAVSSLDPPGPVSAASLASSCCSWRAVDFCSSILGLSRTDACTGALSTLLQHAPGAVPAGLLLQHHQQHAATHSSGAAGHHGQHHQHSVHDALRCLMYGRSLFALYAAEPSRDAWLSLAAALSAHEELQAERQHVLLCQRRAGGPRMQPQWVARRVAFGQQAPAAQPPAANRR